MRVYAIAFTHNHFKLIIDQYGGCQAGIKIKNYCYQFAIMDMYIVIGFFGFENALQIRIQVFMFSLNIYIYIYICQQISPKYHI